MAPLSDREQDVAYRNYLKFVMFGLGRERYAVPVLKVKEIIAAGRVFPLPKMPDFIEGILSLRGEIIPIVDLRKRFDLPEAEDTEESRIVVLEMEDFYVGILVDLVYEVIKLEEDEIEPPPPLVGGLRADYLEGICELDDHLITILDLEEIFSSGEREALAQAAGNADEKPVAGKPVKEAAKAGTKLPAPPKPQVEIPSKRPAPVPEIELEPAREVTVGKDGKIRYSDRMFYLGSRHAGQIVQVEPSKDGVVVRQGGEVIKRFRV